MEEKRRKQAEERERMKAEEEREDRRLAEQREKIRREYEEEQESRKRREMEVRLTHTFLPVVFLGMHNVSVPYQLGINFSISEYWILNCAWLFFSWFFFLCSDYLL